MTTNESLAVLFVVTASLGCAQVLDIDDKTLVSPANGGSGGDGSGGDGGAAPCAEGSCVVTSHAASGDDCYAIAQTTSVLYWTSGAPPAVWRMPKAGGVAAPVFEGGTQPASVTTHAAALFWSLFGSGQLFKSSLDGFAPALLATSLTEPAGIAVDDTGVYAAWRDGIARTPLDGGGITWLVAGQNRPLAVALDATYLYWSAADPPGRGLWRASKDDGSAVVQLLAATSPLFSMDATTIFTYLPASEELVAIDKRSGEVHAVFDEPAAVTGLAIDACCVYWLADDGMLKSVARDGSGLAVRAVDQQLPAPRLGALVVDDARIFWIASGEVRSTPKL